MPLDRQRTPSFIRRAIASQAEPRKQSVASLGVAGDSEGGAGTAGISDVHGTLDLKAIISQGLWTEDHGWSLQWMRIISNGYLDS